MKVLLAIATFAITAFISFPAFAADDKPLDLGEIAYLGGAYTPDGRHFVFAQFPTDGASEINACDTHDGKVKSLGKLKLLTPEPAETEFRYSIGVLAAENDLSLVYVGQYDDDMELKPKSALAWDVKAGTTAPAKNKDEIQAQLKKRSKPAAGAKLTLEDTNAVAVELRKKYQRLARVPDLVGQRTLTIDRGEKSAAKADVTEAFRDLYANVVSDYPNNIVPDYDKGNVLCSDSLSFVAMSGKWIFVDCGVYAHYSIHGRGYHRLIAVNSETGKVHRYPGIAAHSASGIRSEPVSNAFFGSPDGKSVIGISGGRLTLYQAPE